MTDISRRLPRRACARPGHLFARIDPGRILAAMAAAAMFLAPVAAIRAQDGPARISLSSGVVVEPGIETALPIEIEPGKAQPGRSFVRIRGLPPSAKLSDGHAIAPGNWAVPLTSAKDLKLTAPVEAAGRSDIVVSLLSIDGDVLAETRAQLTVAPLWLMRQGDPQQGPEAAAAPAPARREAEVPVARPDPQTGPRLSEPVPLPPKAEPRREAALPKAAPDVAPPPPVPAARPQPPPAPPVAAPVPPPAAPQPPTALEREIADNAARYLGRGTEQLAQGNIREARLFLQRAAELGNARAALTMAQTWDEAEIRRMRLFGPRADAEEAKRWYERAKELGAPEAERLLARLSGVH